MTKVCDECGKPIGGFGGSWEIDGKTVCSTCEKRLRLENEPAIKEELSEDRKSVADHINKEITKEPSNNIDINNREDADLPKYCMECGNALSNNAKFCTNCGTKVVLNMDKEIIKKAHAKETLDSSSPALLDLKASYSILEEVNEVLDNVQKIDKPFAKNIISRLKDIEKLVKNAKKKDSNVYLLNPTGNEKITPEIILSEISFIAGMTGISFIFDYLNTDKGINVFNTQSQAFLEFHQGKVGKYIKQSVSRRAQKNFAQSNDRRATDIAQFYIAFSMDMQTQGINRIGDYIIDIEGNKHLFAVDPVLSKIIVIPEKNVR